MTTFKLEIDDVTKTPSSGYANQYCDDIVINEDSLNDLAKLCHVDVDEDGDFDYEAYEGFYESIYDKLPFFQYAIEDDYGSVMVYSRIKGTFSIQGINVNVDFENEQEHCEKCEDAREMLEKQEYQVIINGKDIGEVFYGDSGVRLWNTLSSDLADYKITLATEEDKDNWNYANDESIFNVLNLASNNFLIKDYTVYLIDHHIKITEGRYAESNGQRFAV